MNLRLPWGNIVSEMANLSKRGWKECKLGKVITSNPRSITDGKGGIIEITGASHPRLEIKIEPMFMYPSDLHLGKLNKSKT